MKLETKRLILRDVRKADAESILKYVNNLMISRYIVPIPFPYTKNDAEWWVNHCAENQEKKPRADYNLGITIKPKNEVVGGAGIFGIDEFSGTGEMGYWIAEPFWRKGYCTEACCAILDFAFYKLKLRKVNIPVFAENQASNALAKKLGGVLEGTLRKHCRAKSTGKIHDENFYGVFEEEWEKAKKRIK